MKPIEFIPILLVLLLMLTLAFRSRIQESDLVKRLRGKHTVASIQKKYSEPVQKRIGQDLESAGFTAFPKELLITAFKTEQILELYGKNEGAWTLIKTYPFTATSGQIGPKLKQGDLQIPEGIYTFEYLNPNSKYHLSAKVSYPNSFDKQKAKEDGRTSLGGDIMIHGDNVTIGCIPIGDEGIEELFILLSYVDFTSVPVIIAPHDFRKKPTFPEIESIRWSDELYKSIEEALHSI